MFKICLKSCQNLGVFPGGVAVASWQRRPTFQHLCNSHHVLSARVVFAPVINLICKRPETIPLSGRPESTCSAHTSRHQRVKSSRLQFNRAKHGCCERSPAETHHHYSFPTPPASIRTVYFLHLSLFTSSLHSYCVFKTHTSQVQRLPAACVFVCVCETQSVCRRWLPVMQWS